ncbi:MAG: DUF4168 domain-containing protein [Geminicoccaceae bacterium]
MRGSIRQVIGALSLVLAAGWLTVAEVQAGDPVKVDDAAGDPVKVDDAKLDSFVDAYNAVHKVASASMEKIQGVKSEEEFKKLQKELEPQFEAAIEDTDGITLAEFREIEAAAIEDEGLGQRIVEKMQVATHSQ